jgi:hypothetical protein
LIINGLENFDEFYSRYDEIVAAMGRSDMAEEKNHRLVFAVFNRHAFLPHLFSHHKNRRRKAASVKDARQQESRKTAKACSRFGQNC